MSTVAALLHFAGRVLIAVSEEILRASWARDAVVPDVIPLWCDEEVDLP